MNWQEDASPTGNAPDTTPRPRPRRTSHLLRDFVTSHPEPRISLGVLRDALRQKSVGVIEAIPEKGIVKYGKPAGIVACIVPTTNPDLTPAGNAIYAIKARDVVIFAPHPRSKKTSFETVRLMREALEGYIQSRPRALPRSLGLADDAGVSAADSEDWIHSRWNEASHRRGESREAESEKR